MLQVQDLHSITPDYFLEVSGAVIHPLSYQQVCWILQPFLCNKVTAALFTPHIFSLLKSTVKLSIVWVNGTFLACRFDKLRS